MVTILLGILKVIGILLLILLGIVLLLVFLVLFCPVRYKGEIEKEEQGKLKAGGEISWLGRLLRLSVRLEGTSPVVQLHIFGITPDDLKRFKERWRKKPSSQKKEPAPKKAAVTEKTENISKQKKEPHEAPELSEPVLEPPKEETSRAAAKQEPPIKEAEPSTAQEISGKKKKKFSPGILKEWLKKLFQAIGSGIKNLIALPKKIVAAIKKPVDAGKKAVHRAEEIKAFVRRQEIREAVPLVWKKVKRLLRHIIPKKLKGSVVFGLEDPGDTGTILAMIAPLYPIYGDSIRVTPDFQEKVFFGSLSLKGRLYGYLLVYIVLSLLIDKNIQYIIRKIRKKEV